VWGVTNRNKWWLKLIFEQIITYNCLKVDLMLNLQAVESLKKNNPKKNI
jgi:hypothetical protein